MSFRDLLRDTLATLWANKRRTMLTMFGNGIGGIASRLLPMGASNAVARLSDRAATRFIVPLAIGGMNSSG